MDFNFKKSLGQNFIFDENFLDGIVRQLGLSKDDIVIEVGTGAGTLTKVLSRYVKNVITYEIDKSLEPVLKKKFENIPNVELYFADAMKITNFPTSFKLVANIPYYITTPLILKFMAQGGCREICVLIQDDVARRIVAKPGGKDYGALSVTLQAGADCEIIRKVQRAVFKPVPKVDSCFVKISKHKTLSYGIDTLSNPRWSNLLKGVFSARRKTMLNALRQTLGINTETACALLAKCDIAEAMRPEQIPVEKFVKLCQNIS